MLVGVVLRLPTDDNCKTLANATPRSSKHICQHVTCDSCDNGGSV